ncbi:unnamed protein product [Malus baccata var. baccata]
MGFDSRWRNLILGEVLSLLIKQAGERKQIEGVIDEYCLASGQQVNKSKSSVYFGGNVPKSLSIQLAAILGMEIVGDPGLYLGVPAIWGKSKKNGLAYIKGRMLGKIQGWKRTTLSQAGHEILIKAVAQAISAYPMNLFKFPSTLCNELDALISKFWWGQKEGENRIHWVYKEILGRSKQDGGLGLRCFSDFNDALLAKQCWRRWCLKPDTSLIVLSLMQNGEEELRGLGQVSLLDEILFSEVDKWLPSIPSGRPSPLGTVQVSRNLRVNSLICTESGDWEVDFLKPFVMEEEIKAILEIPLGDPTLKYRLVWPFEKNRAYSVKSGYHWALSMTHIHRNVNPHRSDMIPTQLWKCMWSLEVPQKIRVFMWKSLHAAVATMANLFFRRSSLSPMCLLCNSTEESTEHLFLKRPWVEAVWNGGSMTRDIGRVGIISWVNWLNDIYDAAYANRGERIKLFSYIAVTCWHIWKSRCNFIFKQQPIYPGQVIVVVHHSVGMFLEANRVPSSRPRINDLDRGNDVSWSPPGSGFIKINVNASWNARECVGFVGVVARDDHGRFVAACRKNISASSVALAEAMAILQGCSLGRYMGWNDIIIESDSLDSVSCLQDLNSMGSWDAFPFLAKCTSMEKAFQDCRWSWVPRSANKAADSLASRQCRERGPISIQHGIRKGTGGGFLGAMVLSPKGEGWCLAHNY